MYDGEKALEHSSRIKTGMAIAEYGNGLGRLNTCMANSAKRMCVKTVSY